MSYFKPMLTDKDLTMCQDVTPNTAEKKEMMYAITWNEAGTRMIQIGIEPTRLLHELKQNEISNVVSAMPLYKGIEIFVADAGTKIVKGATNRTWIGEVLDDLGIATDRVNDSKTVTFHTKVNGTLCRCFLCLDDTYIIAVTMESSFYLRNNIYAVFIVGIYLVLASCCMVYMLSRVLKEKFEKEKLIYTSNTDELTKCFNRHAYETAIHSLDLHKDWIYISMDINGLKRVNDSLGHAAGDELICAAADCMKSCFQNYGNVYRIGGDEFVIIITEKTDVLPNLIANFEQKSAKWRGELVDSMSVSYGYVFSSEKEWNGIYDIAKAADARMYKSKSCYYRKSGIDRRR